MKYTHSIEDVRKLRDERGVGLQEAKHILEKRELEDTVLDFRRVKAEAPEDYQRILEDVLLEIIRKL